MNWIFKDIDELAAFVLSDAGIVESPVDIDRVAYYLGVTKIKTQRLRTEYGRLELSGPDLQIVLSSDMSEARRRFTVAHEIGHLVLADPRLNLSTIRAQRGLSSNERFCDRLAEALLMPAEWVRERYAGAPQAMATLLSCAGTFGVSAAASAVRLQRLLGWSRALLRFEVCRDSWTLLSVTGWRPEPRISIQATQETRAILEQFAHPDSASRLWLPLVANGKGWFVGAELWGRSGWALALVDPRRRRPLLLDRLPGSGTLVDPNPGLKLFYSLDDIDACIMARPINGEGHDERCDHQQKAGVPTPA